MKDRPDDGSKDMAADDRFERAVEWFLRMRSDVASTEDLAELQRWMQIDPLNALAYQQVSVTWGGLDAHASTPELVTGRRDALEDSRRATQRRWSMKPLFRWHWAVAASVLIALAGVSTWYATGSGDLYATQWGERRTVTLEDGSVVFLDARSRVRVRFTESERTITLEEGQAQFVVAGDPLRPFRVHVRDQTVVALGTRFDVELVKEAVLVTLIEGRVAVAGLEPQLASPSEKEVPAEEQRALAGGHGSPELPRVRHMHTRTPAREEGRVIVELTSGEELRILRSGRAALVTHVDVDRASAWQTGKLFFENEPLSSAAERINRYSRRLIVVDPSAAQFGINGVFNAGDADAFIQAVTAYFPVRAERSNPAEVRLTAR